jgi:NhaP-type Na+/H+ or K+/H+ antiporter
MYFLPPLLKNKWMNMPMVFVLFGLVLYSLPLELPFINPENDYFDRKVLEYLTEFIVIISLAAIGLKIDRKPGWKNWKEGWYLIGIAMPLTILFLALAGAYILGLGLAAAVLLGACLSPTDPVLADDIQVEGPNTGEGHPVKFSLTVEAGINDGLAFPFIYLALTLYQEGLQTEAISSWFLEDVLMKITVAIIGGWLLGKAIAWLFYQFYQANESDDTPIGEGLFMLGATLLVYGLIELFNGYGFLGVFIAAVTGRQMDREHSSHKRSYRSITQIENALIGIFLIAFGGVLATGGLNDLHWYHILVSILLLFVIRPVAGHLSLLFCSLDRQKKNFISFFGIRGVGTIYYLTYMHNKSGDFEEVDDVWLVANCTILLSIIIHGLASHFFLPRFEEEANNQPEES